MFFIKKFSYTSKNTDSDYLISKAKWSARKNLIMYKQTVQDKLINKYLKENYNIDLLHLCLQIIAKAKFMTSTQNKSEVTVVVIDKHLDTLASLVTYGNLELAGSNILKNIFK